MNKLLIGGIIVIVVIILISLLLFSGKSTQNNGQSSTSTQNPEFKFFQGVDPPGWDLNAGNMTLEEAKNVVRNTPNVKSFSVFNDGSIHFKSAGKEQISLLQTCASSLCVQPHAGWWVIMTK